MRFTLVLAALAMSTVAFAQEDAGFQFGYAANLNIGDSVVNLSNDGGQGGPFGATFGDGVTPAPTIGNICVNTYVFDPQEEEIGCCSCLVTPNGMNSLSVKNDLISNNLTPAVPTSITIALVATEPGIDKTGAFTTCNPATPTFTGANVPYYFNPVAAAGDTHAGFIANFAMNAWGTTLEPASTPGTYAPVPVRFLIPTIFRQTGGSLAGELSGMTQLCNFIQSNGTGYGICKSCRLGALGGAKN